MCLLIRFSVQCSVIKRQNKTNYTQSFRNGRIAILIKIVQNNAQSTRPFQAKTTVNESMGVKVKSNFIAW